MLSVLPQPLSDQVSDLLTVDDDELGTTTDEGSGDDMMAGDSDGDIELPRANADLLASMGGKDDKSARESRDSKIAGILPPASANLLIDIIGGRKQGDRPNQKGTQKSRPASSKKPLPIKTDSSGSYGFPSTLSPALRELFGEDEAASMYSGDESQSFLNLSSDDDRLGEDWVSPASDVGEFSDAGEGLLDEPMSPEEAERAAKLGEAGLPSISIASLELVNANIALPLPSAPVWMTNVDEIDVYLTLLPRPRVGPSSGSLPGTPARSHDNSSNALALLGAQIPILRRVDNGSVNATTLLLAGGLISDRERSTVLSLEMVKNKIRKKAGLVGTWIPLNRARELARTYLLEAKLAFFLSDGLPKVFVGIAPLSTRALRKGVFRFAFSFIQLFLALQCCFLFQSAPASVASVPDPESSKPEPNVEEPTAEYQDQLDEPMKEKESNLEINEKLIKRLKKLVESGGPHPGMTVSSASAAEAGLGTSRSMVLPREGRRRAARTDLGVLNATLTSISTGTNTNAGNDLFLISPTLFASAPSRSVPPMATRAGASIPRREMQPPSSLMDHLGLETGVLHEPEHFLAHDWASSDDDEEKVQRRREALRKRTAAVAAAEAAARVKAEHGSDTEEEEDEEVLSWFGSDHEDDDLPIPVGVLFSSSDEDEGYERDDEKDDGDTTDDESPANGSASTAGKRSSETKSRSFRPMDDPEDDMEDVEVERTVIVTTSITIPNGTFKGRRVRSAYSDDDDFVPAPSSRNGIRPVTRKPTPTSRLATTAPRSATSTPKRTGLPPMGSFAGPVMGSFTPSASPKLVARNSPPSERPLTPKLEHQPLPFPAIADLAKPASFPRISQSPPPSFKRAGEPLTNGNDKRAKVVTPSAGDETETEEDE